MRILSFAFKAFAVIALLGAAGFFVFAPGIAERAKNPVKPHSPYPVSASAVELHENLILGDWHADTLLWNRNLNDRGRRGHVDIPRLIEGNVVLQVFTAVTKVPAGLNYLSNAADARDNATLLAFGQLWPPRTWFDLTERALYEADRLRHAAKESDGRLRLVLDREGLEALLAEKRSGMDIVGGILGIEGAHALSGDLDNLDRLEAAGYRLVGLHHFFDNELGGSLHGEAGGGLTEFGRQVVREIERRGMVLDLAHSSERVVREVLAMTDRPVVLSHTGIRSHCRTRRNLPDDLMRAIVRTGGVVGIGYWRSVTCDDSPAGIAASIAAAIGVVGEDHVSLGSDFDGAVETALDASELAALTQAMLDRGLTEAQIRKVAGENMLRVLRARLP